MRTIQKLARVFLIVSLSCSTFYLWGKLHRLRQEHHKLKQTLIHPKRETEIDKEYVKLSNKSSDLVYEPALPNGSPYKLVILSLSAGKYHQRRSAVRDTWNKRLRIWNMNYDKILHYFICFTPRNGAIAEDLLLEATNYRDIVIFADRDKYSELATQTLSALDWLESKFEFEFVLKTDDDSLVNVDFVYKWLENKEGGLYAGLR